MAQGKKYNDDIKERAFALLACQNNCSYVAKTLGLPYSTVKTWEKQFLKKSAEREEKEKKSREGSIEDTSFSTSQNSEADECDLAKLRNKKKEDFVTKAWGMIENAQSLIERRLLRAVNEEGELDRLLSEFEKLDSEDIGETERKAMYRKFSAIKLESIKELSSVLGVLYDKQALANKEATVNLGGSVAVGMKFEDL